MSVSLKTNDCLIGLDLGTSAIKGVLMDLGGRVLSEASAETCLVHPCPGWVEADPEQHYRTVCGVIQKLVGVAPGEIVGLAMAAASGNTLLTDRQGMVLTNIINWMDQRAEQRPPSRLAGLTSDQVRQVTGWPCVRTFPLAHLAWLKDNRPNLYAEATHYGMDTDWLLHRLTGRWVMDHSTATTFHLQSQTQQAFHEPFLERLGLVERSLSKLVPVGELVGPLCERALHDTGLTKRTMVVAGCFDHPAAARSVGVLEEGQLMLSCGTSWVGFAPHNVRNEILGADLLCDPFLSSHNGPWAGMFSVPYIGKTIDWYIDHAIAPGEGVEKMRIFNESAGEAEAGAGGLEIDLTRAPHVPGGVERKNISRAVMEGAARLFNRTLQRVRGHGFVFDRAVLVGGPSSSAVWPGIIASITGLELEIGSRHAGAKGAAMIAGIGVGVYRDEKAALAAWRDSDANR